MSVMFSEKEKMTIFTTLFFKCFQNKNKQKCQNFYAGIIMQELFHTNRNGLILFFTGLFFNFPF